MIAAPFVDTNIFVYALLAKDPRRSRAALTVRRPLTISAQIVNEFANVAHRKFRLPWAETIDLIDDLLAMATRCIPLAIETNRLALSLSGRYQFAFYDALIVASALEAGCDTLLTEDMAHGQLIEGRLTITNPFRD